MSDTAEYTYLTLPPDDSLRSCLGLVVAGMAARARIGVGGLDEAVELLEARHSPEVPTRYRFTLSDDGIVAEVEETSVAGVPGTGRAPREQDGVASWRTVVELVA